MVPFDDYLGLDRSDLSRFRLVVFIGRSGSGKSTAIDHLLTTHPAFRARESVVLQRPLFAPPDGLPGVVALDDLLEVRELRVVAGLVRSGRTVLVASHLGPMWYQLLSLFVPAIVFRTDRDEAKVARYLRGKGIDASASATRAFVRRFGATYTDIDIILDRYPERSFDAALARFQRFCRLELESPGG